MPCLQAIGGEDAQPPTSFAISWTSSGHWATKASVRFCWVPSHYGIKGNKIVDQLAKETLDHDIDLLTTVYYADLKPLLSPYIKQEVQTKWDVFIHGGDLYFVKPILGPPKKFQHMTRAKGIVITRLWIGLTEATKSHILSPGPPTTCQHCGQTLTIDHMLLECTVLQQSRNEYYTADSLGSLFEMVPETCIVEFLREAGFLYLIWITIYPEQLLIEISHQVTRLLTRISPRNTIRLGNQFMHLKQLWENHTCEEWLIYPEGHVSSLNQSNPIQSFDFLQMGLGVSWAG